MSRHSAFQRFMGHGSGNDFGFTALAYTLAAV